MPGETGDPRTLKATIKSHRERKANEVSYAEDAARHLAHHLALEELESLRLLKLLRKLSNQVRAK